MSVMPILMRNALFATPGPRLPGDMLGVWYADQYDGTNFYIPNARVASPTPSANILRGVRRVFNSALYTRTSVTVTDNYAAAPDGKIAASRLVGDNSHDWQLVSGITLPNGTYTVVAYYKSNTGASQSIRRTINASSATLSLTTAWQRLATTVVVAAGSLTIAWARSLDGTTAGDVLIDGAGVYLGSSDLGPDTLVGHLYTGQYGTAALQPTLSAGVLDFTGQMGVIQFSDAVNAGPFTAQAVVSHFGSRGANQQPFFTSLGQPSLFSPRFYWSDNANAIPTSDQTYFPNYFTAATVAQGLHGQFNYAYYEGSPAYGLLDTFGAGFHVHTYRYDGTKEEYWIDDVRIFVVQRALSSAPIGDLMFNAFNTGTTGNAKYLGSALGLRYHSNSEMNASIAFWKMKAQSAASIDLRSNFPTRVYIAEGDSITDFPYSYSFLLGPAAASKTWGAVYAVSGSEPVDLPLRAADLDDVISTTRSCKFILSNLVTNALATYAGTDTQAAQSYVNDVFAWFDARAAKGFLPIVITLPPRANATHNTRRNIANPLFRSGAVSRGWPVADFAADPTYGTDAAGSDVTKYPDGIHPNAAAHQQFLTIIKAVYDAM